MENYDKVKALSRIKELIVTLNEAIYAYEVEDNEIISNKEYDALFDELKALEVQTDIVFANSPTQRVGHKIIDKLPKVRHSEPMLSLDKTKEVLDIKKWLGKKVGVLSWKMDGCFAGNMKVHMADGTKKKIKDIKIGDMVLSFDEKTLKAIPSKVINKFNNGLKPIEEWLRVGIYNSKYNYKNSVHVTKNHKFFTPNGWNEIKDIKIGEKIYTYDYELSNTQISVLLGTSLGDGCSINRNKHDYGIEYRYSKTNKLPYSTIINKYSILFKDVLSFDKKSVSGYKSEIKTQYLKTLYHLPSFLNNKKNVLRTGYTFTQEVLDNLTPIALALYYIDDGSKTQCKDDSYNVKNVTVRAMLSTYRHKLPQVKMLSNFLKSKYGIDNNIRKDRILQTGNGDGYVIDITAEGTEVFFDLIASYIPKELRQIKLGMKDKWQNAPEIKWWEDYGEYKLVENVIEVSEQSHYQSCKTKIKKRLTAYDIEVENTHNYIIEGFCVHNCTVVLTYENGILVSAVTRGDGEIGQDIIHNIIAFKNIPSTIPYKGKVEIRGEAVISNKNFEKINDAVVLAGGKPFATARNLASGSVKLLDSKTTQQRHLEFFAFQLISSSTSFQKKVEQMIFLEQQGFTVVGYKIVDEKCIEEAIKAFTDAAENYEYPVDGLVITYDDIAYCDSLDITSHHPLHSMAFKWADEVYQTPFEYIDYNTTRTGIISQTAVFEMVEIDGTEVRRALIPNLDYFNKLKLGKGDIIEVFKANMIKPEIFRNVTMSGTEKLIEECPACGGAVIIDGKFLKCANPDCSAKIVNKLKHFVSRDCMNIEGISIATIEKFVDKGWITTFGDIYRLSEHKEEIEKMDGFGKPSYEKMIKGIEASKTVAFQNFVNALGIKLVGLSTAKDLAKAYNYDIKLLVKTTWGDLHKISGIGGETAQAIHDYFKNAENLVMINDLLQYVAIEQPAATATDQRFEGMTFVITGTLSKDRNHFKDIIEGFGGKTSDSVSKKTNYLLAGDKAGSKLEKANTLGVKVLNENDFENLIK